MVTKARRARFDFNYYRDAKYRPPGRRPGLGSLLLVFVPLAWLNAVVWGMVLAALFGGK